MSRSRRIVAVHLSDDRPNGSRRRAHHIENVRWIKDGDPSGGERTRDAAQVAKKIEVEKKHYYVRGTDGLEVDVRVAHRKSGRAYLHTAPDGDQLDNLLALPTF